MPTELHAAMELRGWRQDEEVEHILIVLSDVYDSRMEMKWFFDIKKGGKSV